MKVSISWLNELVNLKIPLEELVHLIPMRTIGIKETTKDFIELDMKGYNRADLLSMRGVAKEVAAITDSSVKFTPENSYIWEGKDLPEVKVAVEDSQLCPVYCVAKIEGLKVEFSPPDWVKKLADSGIRAVNNVADVTNLVMVEYGQPMHAFDAKGVYNETISVRTAQKGERITALDGKTRDLETGDLLITDPQNPLGIAGVMGGKDSQISDITTTILLEAAIFDSKSIRKTATRLSLHSEASKKFQHGLTKTNLLQALSAAIKMYEQLGGRLTAISLTGDLEDKPKKVVLTQKKVNELIGLEIPPEQVESSLRKLGFSLGVISGTPPRWEVTVAYWRLDISIEEDLIEEVARMYGYEKIPAKELKGELPEKIDQTLPDFIYDLKAALADAGLTEVQTYSFFSTTTLHSLGFDQLDTSKVSSKLVKVANPISAETEYLRQNIWPNLVEVVGKNLRNGFKDIAIFEVGKAYIPADNGLPTEEYRLSVAICDGSDNPIAQLSILLNTISGLHLPGENPTNSRLHLGDGQGGGKIFHPTRFKNLEYNGRPIGVLAEVHPRILNKYGIDKRVAILEIDLSSF